MSTCYNSYRKKNIKKTGEYLLNQQCCDYKSCMELVDDLQDLQFKCNDVFREINILEKDEKGNIAGTICADLRDKKKAILDRFNGAKSGGRKKRRSTIKRRRIGSKNRKLTRRNRKQQ
jgi:hypothetical protein